MVFLLVSVCFIFIAMFVFMRLFRKRDATAPEPIAEL